MTAAEIGERFTEGSLSFDEMAKLVFEHQRASSPIYRRFAGDHVWFDWTTAPFLPVEAFKWSGIVDTESNPPDITFASSGTGGPRSRHPVFDLQMYERSVVSHFDAVFGIGLFDVIAHLPTYRSPNDPSSLLYMVDLLIRRFGTSVSCFVNDESDFDRALESRALDNTPLIIFGTAFGLIDMVESTQRRLPRDSRIIETGGMKTHRREVTREELHRRLADGFGLDRSRVWSEYGMCELLSQCYTRGRDVFYPPPWMRTQVVDPENPDRPVAPGYPGLLALFDLANVHSVSAILTSDLAIEREGGFELLGRAEASEIRGCNFLMGSNP